MICSASILPKQLTEHLPFFTASLTFLEFTHSAYNGNRWTALYFVSFMILSFFFLLNIILASIVNEYDEAAAARKTDATQAAHDNLKEAFTLMDVHENGRIDRETVMALFAILNEDFPEFRHLSDDETKLLFAILDQDGSSTITEDEFMNFVSG